MKLKVLIWLAATAMVLAGCRERKYAEYLEYSPAIDLTDIASAYERYTSQGDNANEFELMGKLREDKYRNLSKEMRVQSPAEMHSFFEGRKYMIGLPQYANSQNPFLATAEDLYNSSAIVWNVWSNYELWTRTWFEVDDASEYRRTVQQSIMSIDANLLRSDTLRTVAEWYKSYMSEALNASSYEMDDDSVPFAARDSMLHVIGRYSYSYYDNREAFSSLVDSILGACLDLSEARIQRYNQASKDQRLGVAIAELTSCETFDEQCSFLLLWANNEYSVPDNEWIMAVSERLMQSGNYNPLLSYVWLTWRCISQYERWGMSCDSFIPNGYYNDFRRICYQSCLKRIEACPADHFAMNCATLLACTENLKRLGSSMFGNEAVVEMINTMPNRYKGLFDNEDNADEGDD